MKKERIILYGSLIAGILLLLAVWNSWFSVTKIGFVNYQAINLGEISKANNNPFIRLAEISTDRLDELGSCDMVFINAMGIRITGDCPCSRPQSPILPTTSARSTLPPPPPCGNTSPAADGATTEACWNTCARQWTAN